MRSPARRRQTGFTLVEVIIASTLLGVMMLLITGSLRMGAQSWDNGEEKLAKTSRRFVVQNFLRRHLSSMVPVAATPQPGEDQALSFSGKRNGFKYVAALPTQVKRGGLYVFNLYVGGAPGQRDLRLSITPFVQNPKAGDKVEPVDDLALVEDVDKVEFSYLPPAMQPGVGSRWSDEWAQAQMPVLIRLDIQPSDAPAWPPMLIAPKIHALR